MKISNDAVEELKKIRNALDNMYDKLNTTLFEKKVAMKTTYKEVNPFDGVSENFSYIADKLKQLESSEIVED
jgi:uncharacterized protein Yka (UPF0111/DUF47 family)|tara:strand:+ start:587 stop:802 length:216 start_codon:yes stop_codon:yes gene_type:complete